MIETHSHSQGISAFMRWAERRIVEEVEANEKFEQQTGSKSAIKESTHLGHGWTLEQKQKMIDAIDDLRNAGCKGKNACKKIGVHASTYSTWRKQLGMGKFKK